MGDGDDINLVLPVEKHDKVRESLENDATGSMQLGGITKRKFNCRGKGRPQVVAKPARRGDAPLGVPDRRQYGESKVH